MPVMDIDERSFMYCGRSVTVATDSVVSGMIVRLILLAHVQGSRAIGLCAR